MHPVPIQQFGRQKRGRQEERPGGHIGFHDPYQLRIHVETNRKTEGLDFFQNFRSRFSDEIRIFQPGSKNVIVALLEKVRPNLPMKALPKNPPAEKEVKSVRGTKPVANSKNAVKPKVCSMKNNMIRPAVMISSNVTFLKQTNTIC